MKTGVLAGMALLLATPVLAGNIYICQGKHGEKVYQSTACPKAQKQLGHQTYDDALGHPAGEPTFDGQPAGVYERGAGTSTQLAPPARRVATRYVAPHAPPLTGVYLCQGDGSQWLQIGGCPATYPEARSAHVTTYNFAGLPMQGYATFTQQLPVRAVRLNANQVCEQLGMETHIEGAGDDAGQSYARNRLKDQYCGG